MNRPAEAKLKLFTNGGSKAVRLTKDFTFEGTEVIATRDGDAVILRPAGSWPPGYMDALRRSRSSDIEAPPREDGKATAARLDRLFGGKA